MIRYLFILLLIYLLYRFIRFYLVIRKASRKVRENMPEEPVAPQKETKIISKEEGEYVDFEEIKP